MDKETMMATVRKALLERLQDPHYNFQVNIAEMVWDEIPYPDDNNDELTDAEDKELTGLFDDCFNELLQKIKDALT